MLSSGGVRLKPRAAKMKLMFSNRKLFKQSSLLYFPKLLTWLGSYVAFTLLFRTRGAGEYGTFVVITAYWGIPAMIAGDIIGCSGQRLLAEVSGQSRERINQAFKTIWSFHAVA